MTMDAIPAGGFAPLWNNLTHGGALSTIDADAEAICVVCQIPRSGTLTDVAFYAASITTGDAGMLAEIETVGADGLPTGVRYKTNSNGIINIASVDDNIVKTAGINGGAGVSCARGDVVAIYIKRPASGTMNGAFRTISPLSTIYAGFPYGLDYQITAAGVWTKKYNYPSIALNIGGWICPPGTALLGTPLLENFASPKERGILVNFPLKTRLAGFYAYITAVAGEDFIGKLYSDPTGTPVERATTNTYDADQRQITTASWHYFMFNTPYEMGKDTDYVIAIQATTAGAIDLAYFLAEAAYSACHMFGPGAVLYGRDNAASGAFSATATKIPVIIPLIDQIEDAASGGGGGISRGRLML